MDNHPIPQDVTGFQFRLIGNMTVKQFAYVGVGAVGAVIIFYLPLFALIKVIFIPLFIITGVSLAFLPIEGRPVDVMVSHFLKAIFSPNQFIYHKEGGHLMLSTIRIDSKAVQQAAALSNGTAKPTLSQQEKQQARREQLSSYLNTIHQNQATDEKEASRLSALFSDTPAVAPAPQPLPVELSAPVAVAPVTAPEPVIPEVASPEPIPAPPIQEASVSDAETLLQIQKDTDKIAEEESLIKQTNEELSRAKAEEGGATGAPQETAHMKVLEMEQKLQQLMQAKQQLEAELLSLKETQTKKVISTPNIPTVPVTPPPTLKEKPVQTVPSAPATGTAGFPSLPDVPNILLGVVRDSSGNVLPHILVEVKDKDDNPVRAFKTNQLGQFLSATQLKDGIYTIHLEDAKNQYKFDVITLTVNNQILPPLEIAAHDLREELRKSLFA